MNLLARYLQASPAVAGCAKGSFLSSLHIDVRISPSYVHPARNPPSDHVSLPFDQPLTVLPQVSPEMWQVSLHQAGELGNPQPDPMWHKSKPERISLYSILQKPIEGIGMDQSNVKNGEELDKAPYSWRCTCAQLIHRHGWSKCTYTHKHGCINWLEYVIIWYQMYIIQ